MSDTAKRVAFYLRVSTRDQNTENQRLELEAAASLRGWTVVEVYEDKGISGSKGRDKRPAFDACLKAGAKGAYDVLAVWSVDRIGRSTVDLVNTLQELRHTGRDLFILKQQLDTTSPSGRAMFGMLGIFAEFEREMIVARVHTGLARAKSQGIKCGRPAHGPDVVVQVLAEPTMPIRKLAALVGISHGSIQSIRRDHPVSVEG